MTFQAQRSPCQILILGPNCLGDEFQILTKFYESGSLSNMLQSLVMIDQVTLDVKKEKKD